MPLPLTGSRTIGRRSSVAWLLAASLATSLAAAGFAAITPARVTATNLSDFTVIPAAGGTGISPAAAGGSWTTLTGPAIDIAVYSNPDVFPPDLMFTLTLPANFEWNAEETAPPVVSVAPGMPAGFCSLVPSALTYSGAGDAPRAVRFTLGGTHDIGCVVSLRGLQVRPISADARAGAGGSLMIVWGAPQLGTTRVSGGIVSLAGAAPAVLPPTDAAAPLSHSSTPGRGAFPPLPGIIVAALALVGAGWSVRRQAVPRGAATRMACHRDAECPVNSGAGADQARGRRR